MNYIFFDYQTRENLLPFTYTAPVSEIRVGILTLREKWEKFLNSKCSFITEKYLSEKYSTILGDDNILINPSLIPDEEVLNEINLLKQNESIVKNELTLALRVGRDQVDTFQNAKFTEKQYKNDIIYIENTWDIFKYNGSAIKKDFELITNNRKSCKISTTNNLLGTENIFIEEGAKLEFTTINATSGPVYIGKNAEIMEGSVIRGPFALCDNSTVKLSAKIYGPTTIGPHCKVGGEINNSVFFEYSNKAHDGFLGNSVIGRWCNIGADSNNSNLKNNYAMVRLWNYKTENFAKTGLQFCGLMLGDHSKCAINTMFNTGTVVGVSANIYGSGFPRNFVPSFSWGGASGVSEYALKKALDVAEIVMKRRDIELDQKEIDILTHVFEITKKYRKQ